MTSGSWEEALVADYGDRHWQEIMEPLCETFRRWKSGQVDHAEVDRVLDAAYRQKCALDSLLGQRPDRAAAIIEVTDHEWFMVWIEGNRPRADVESSEPLAEGCGEVITIAEMPEP